MKCLPASGSINRRVCFPQSRNTGADVSPGEYQSHAGNLAEIGDAIAGELDRHSGKLYHANEIRIPEDQSLEETGRDGEASGEEV